MQNRMLYQDHELIQVNQNMPKFLIILTKFVSTVEPLFWRFDCISYLHVTEHKYVSSKCLEILSQIASEAI